MPPGTAKTSLPCSKAHLAVMSDPLDWVPLHHQHPQAQPGDEPVAHGEVGTVGRRPWGIFTHQRPVGGHVLIEVPVSGRIDHVDAVAQDGDDPSAALQGTPQGRTVDAIGAAADHHGPMPCQVQGHASRDHHAVGAGLSGPHHGHGGLLVDLGQLAPDVQHAGCGVQLDQPLGIGRVLTGQNADVQRVALGQDAVGSREILVQQRPADLRGQVRHLVIGRFAGEIGPLRGAEVLQQTGRIHAGGRSPGAQPQPVAQVAHGRLLPRLALAGGVSCLLLSAVHGKRKKLPPGRRFYYYISPFCPCQIQNREK